jgi:hypothetical protein
MFSAQPSYEAGCVAVRLAPAEAGKALHRHTVSVGRFRGNRVTHRERAVQLVAPFDRDGLRALCLDRRAWNQPFEPPDARRGKVTVKLVRPGANAHREPAVMLRCDQP